MIDIKTLRIGSHVLVDGKRVRVCGITKRKIGYHHPDERPNAHLRYARVDEVEPIPITSELLKELKFAILTTNPPQDPDVKRHTEGIYIPPRYIKIIGTREIRMTRFASGDWRAQAYDDGFATIFSVVEYLHELEMLVYQAMDIELIKD